MFIVDTTISKFDMLFWDAIFSDCGIRAVDLECRVTLWDNV